MTDFGYRDVAPEEKTRLVESVFSSVADRYDVMNDLMSAGIHRLWKRHFVGQAGIRSGQRVLDLAGGTGDIAELVRRRVGATGEVLVADINRDMLEAGRRRMDDHGFPGAFEWLQVNAESLPFGDRRFDHVTIAFGLRNVTDKPQALSEMHRVLKPGGRLHVLEFSKVSPRPVERAYDFWSFQVLPRLGQLVASDRDSYRYLAESIRRFPNQEKLAGMLDEVGFERVTWENLSAGIAAIHRGARV
jgi:demethylmenaquinone methyltransferase/2-methoxy-6-polyprenyl-1,4-benzoquinol methylase